MVEAELQFAEKGSKVALVLGDVATKVSHGHGGRYLQNSATLSTAKQVDVAIKLRFRLKQCIVKQ